jgi:hypothetical protein
MTFLYRRPDRPLDFICRQTDLSRVRSKIATERNGDQVMRAQAVVQERRALLADWMSKKSMRLAMLLVGLLTVSIAVNALIILADGGRP